MSTRISIDSNLRIPPVINAMSIQWRYTASVAPLCRILLSDAMDPLTRTPLKEEDLIPDAALKSRIEQWKTEMRKKAFEKAQQQ